MSATFAELCQTTGKTDAEIAELAGVKATTIGMYKKTNKPSKVCVDVVARLLGGVPMETPVAQPRMEPINMDRELVPTDFEDNADWHFCRIQDSGPGGIERVRADVAQLKAGIPFRMGGRYLRYQEAHRFSDSFVVMKCPMADFLDYEKNAQAHAHAQWPETAKPVGDGISTETKREQRFIEGSAGLPTGEPVAA